ncbi:MAG TPA: FecR domain-containing protein [Rhizomicrobium sp.]|nr:FecR domain-containing protein [Rhizomicrobium sp.]
MSEPEMPGPTVDARDAKTRAAAFLEQRDRADWSADDQARLDAWLAQSPGNLLAFWRVEAAWDQTARLIAVRPFERRAVQPERRGTVLAALAKLVAGCAALAILGGGFLLFTPGTREQAHATAIGGHEIVSLADGSKIELNTDTQVRTDVSPDHRFAAIDKGEAYFQIAHDAKRPFVVAAGNRRITVLGTKFIVRQSPERLEVSLLDGRIWFDAGNRKLQPQAVLMAPGDVVIATANTVFVKHASEHQLANELGWRNGVLIFDNTTLADAVAQFNRYNTRKIVLTDSAVGHLKLVGTFPKQDLNAFIDIAQEVFNLRVQRRADMIAISR